jgi:hypothetical protein
MEVPALLKERIKQDAITRVREQKLEQTSNIHFYKDVLEKGQKIRAGPIEKEMQQKTAVVFVDLMPNYNWAHPAKIMLYDAEKGQLYNTIEANFPLNIMETQPSKMEAFSAPVKMFDTQKNRIVKGGIPPIFKSSLTKRYAILFSGYSNNRHLNDLEYLYRTLIDIYGFDAENIYILNFNGTLSYLGASNPIGNWPGNNTPYRLTGHITGPGTREAMESVLDQIAQKIKSPDLLFIHTNDHGAGPGDGVDDYCLLSYKSSSEWAPYYVNDFVSKLKMLPKFDKLMVMMEQCRSGGFVTPIINNSPANWTHVAAAVKASDYSMAGPFFDPFAEDWIAAITGQYQGGGAMIQQVDTNNDARVSATEAFSYANAVRHNSDTPVSTDKPNGYGAYIFLGLSGNDPLIRQRIPAERVRELIPTPIPELTKDLSTLKLKLSRKQ